VGFGMKIPRYNSSKDNPAVKGLLPIEDIIRADWERNYKNSGVTYEQAEGNLRQLLALAGTPASKVRNTIIVTIPQDDYEEVEFHTLTADPFEVYFMSVVTFFISLAMKKGTQYVYTYLDDKKIFRQIKGYFGEYASIEPNDDDPDKGKYVLTIEIGPFVAAMQRKAAEGGDNGLG
jgi:hypothetical protein